GWLEGKASEGLRRCLASEFSSVDVFHLRGNARTSGERRRKEKDNVFGQGTRTPVAITLLTKNPAAEVTGKIRFHDIGDYLSRSEKLSIVSRYASMGGIERAQCWTTIVPNKHGDWLNQRSEDFSLLYPMGSRSSDRAALFLRYSNGVQTNRDPWCQNFSKAALDENAEAMVENYHRAM